jgi:predicted metal-dependent hydrolase
VEPLFDPDEPFEPEAVAHPARTVAVSLVPPEVRVIRSDKRRRTISARMVNGVMELRIPARTSQAEEKRWIAEMSARFMRKKASEEVDLMARARILSVQCDLPVPETIRWVTNQEQRWGSCTPADRAIRISDKLIGAPLWVLDYVVVHEMAHLRFADHSPKFWALVNRYPKTERARGYLMALGLNEGDAHEDDDS